MKWGVLALVLGFWTAGCSQEKTPYTVVDETSNPPRITPSLTNRPVTPAPQAPSTNAPQSPNP